MVISNRQLEVSGFLISWRSAWVATVRTAKQRKMEQRLPLFQSDLDQNGALIVLP